MILLCGLSCGKRDTRDRSTADYVLVVCKEISSDQVQTTLRLYPASNAEVDFGSVSHHEKCGDPRQEIGNFRAGAGYHKNGEGTEVEEAVTGQMEEHG